MRRLDALAARAVEDLRRGGVKRHGEDVGTHLVQARHVLARHGRRVRQDGNRNGRRIDPVGPFLQDGDGIAVGIGMGDHRDAHAVEGRTFHVGCHDVDDLLHRHGRPVDADEIAVGIVALGLAVARQAAIGAVGPAAFRVGQEQVEAARAAAAMHPARHQAERDGRRRRHLHIVGRAHVRRQNVVFWEISPFGRHIVVLHAPAIAQFGRRLRRHPGLHQVEAVEIQSARASRAGLGAFRFQTGHAVILVFSKVCVPAQYSG